MEGIIQKIEIILNEEKRSYAANGRIRGGLGSFPVRVGDSGFTLEGQVPQILNDISTIEALQSANANLLLKLHSKVSDEDKVKFQEYLLEQLDKNGKYFDIAYLIFFVLYRIGVAIPAIGKARLNLKGDSDHGFSNLLGMLAKIVYYEYTFISSTELQQIKIAMEGENEHNFGLFQKINAAEFKLLERELDDVNLQINSDRDKIINIWSNNFNSSNIPNLVKEIEEYFFEGEFTPTKYATCIGRIRVFITECSKEIAGKVSEKLKDGKSISTLSEHAIFDYLRSTGTASDDEWSLLRNIYGMTSNDGAHAAVAPREYARITKNIAYEAVLMLLEHSDSRF